jgi:hypothetical protein
VCDTARGDLHPALIHSPDGVGLIRPIDSEAVAHSFACFRTVHARPPSVNGEVALYWPSGGHFLLNLSRRSLADRDSLGVSLRGLCATRSSGQQALGRRAWPLLLLALLFLSVPWIGECQEYKAQQAGKVYRIGFLRAGEPLKLWIEEFRQG